MSTILYRWGRAAASRPWRMIAAWLAVAAARGRVLAANLALHPDEPDGGGCGRLWPSTF